MELKFIDLNSSLYIYIYIFFFFEKEDKDVLLRQAR